MGVKTNSRSKITAALADEGIIITDHTFKPIAVDRGAAAILNNLDPQGSPSESCSCLPEEILQPLKRRNFADDGSARMQVWVGPDVYICRAYSMQSTNGGPRFTIAIHLQRDSSASDAVYHVAAEYDLTDREKEALVGIAMGLTSKEVAERMNISPNTVRAFVRLIMIKMGVTRRVAIVSRLLEYNGAQFDQNGASNGSSLS